MIKKIKVILLFVGGAIIVLGVFRMLVIGLPKSGQVLDSVTKEPIGGISLERRTDLIVHGFHGSRTEIIRTEIMKSDGNGKFYFSPFIKTKLSSRVNLLEILLIGVSYNELLNVNGDESSFGDDSEGEKYRAGLDYNKDYSTDMLGRGFYEGLFFKDRKPYKQEGHTFKPFNSKTIIYLAPLVANLKDCRGDIECIEKNTELVESCKKYPSGPGSDFRCKSFNLTGQ